MKNMYFDLFESMVEGYRDASLHEQKVAVKEAIQELILCGLSKSGFFKIAALHGGSALRLFHGLDRFSEDLDFNLIAKPQYFDFSRYLCAVEEELRSYGLCMGIEEKSKTYSTSIRSAYVKGTARKIMTKAYGPSVGNRIAANEYIKIKIDLEPEPEEGFVCASDSLPLSIPNSIRAFDGPSLFAGKIGAVLGRQWGSRIKGRDLYDYVFYIDSGESVNLGYLKFMLVESGLIDKSFDLTQDSLKDLLNKKFDSLTEADYESAQSDAIGFIGEDNKRVVSWDKDFFKSVTNNLKAKGNGYYNLDCWKSFVFNGDTYGADRAYSKPGAKNLKDKGDGPDNFSGK